MEIVKILEEFLGSIQNTYTKNWVFNTPFDSSHKPKLWISRDLEGLWHCWMTNRAGTSLKSLVEAVVHDRKKSNDILNRLSAHTGIRKFRENRDSSPLSEQVSNIFSQDLTFGKINFPKNVKYLSDHKNESFINYLTNRGITNSDIRHHSIGFIDSECLFMPSWDSKLTPNYYVLKNIYSEKYILPSKSKTSIIFGEHLINWRLPIVLVEGIFDAIKVRHQAIPLLGKTLPTKSFLYQRLIKSPCELIYVMLDADAQEYADQIVYQLSRFGKDVRKVPLSFGDPGDMQTDDIWNRINSVEKPSFYETIINKLAC